MIARFLILVSSVVLASGCLKTRAELRGEDEGGEELQRQTSVQRREEARVGGQQPAKNVKTPPPAPKGDDIDDQFRQLNGRVDTVENQVQQQASTFQAEKESVTKMAQAIDQKFASYEEAIKKLEAQVAALTALVAAQDTKASGGSQGAGSAAPKGKSSYEEGEELFGAKKWKEAIVSYQKYRDNNPKGKQYADATYKIGLCFQELKMKDEAKAFFDEVTSKFPGSKEAKKAAFRSKQLK